MTLIEVLVVLTLIAVSAGIVGYAVPGGQSPRDLDQEAELLAARLNIAAERSLISGTAHRFEWSAQGYSFRTWQDGAWEQATGAPLSNVHRFEAETQLSGQNGTSRGAVRITPALLPDGSAEAAFVLSSGAASRALLFDGAGARVTGALP